MKIIEKEEITAKVVTKSKPYMEKDGSRWMSDIVYLRNGEYYTRKVKAPSQEYGPFEIGEEIIIEPEFSDKKPEEWMIEIYHDPSSYKEVVRREKYRKQDEEDAKNHEDEESGFGNKLLNLIIVLLIIIIIGVILKTIIWG